jgi:KIX domain
MQHEYDCHRQHLEWRCMYRTCPADAVIFLSEDDFRAHLVGHHRTSLSEDSVLLLIAKTCRRVVASRPDANIDCPVCLLSIPNKRSKIGRHLGRHMEDIALPIISLVVPTDEDTDVSDKSDEETNSDNEDPPPHINHLASIYREDAKEAGLSPVNSSPKAENAPVRTSSGNNTMQRYIISALQQQGPFSGWQATITVDQRAIQVRLLIDSLRLIKPVIELGRAVQVAISFEQKAFMQNQSLDAYVSICKDKLSQIHETRQQQQNSMNAQNAPNQTSSMQQMQQAQQMQQISQNPNFSAQQQQHQQHQQQQSSLNMGQAMDPNITAHQGGMQESTNFMQGQQPKSLPPWKPSKEDNEAINKLAAQMAEKTPPEDIAKIRANLDNMTAQQRELMNQKGIDPLVYFFRTQATKEYRRQKMNPMAAGSIAGGTDGNQNNGLQGQEVTDSRRTFSGRYHLRGLRGHGSKARVEQ